MRAPTAYSCGGSHGFGPLWVRRTVFPFDPLALKHVGNHCGLTITPRAGPGQSPKIGMGIADGDPVEIGADGFEHRIAGLHFNVAGDGVVVEAGRIVGG
jgi:hypothetical protein